MLHQFFNDIRNFYFKHFKRDRLSLKWKVKITTRKTLTRRRPMYTIRDPRIQFINTEIYPGRLEEPLTRTNFHGPKPVLL